MIRSGFSLLLAFLLLPAFAGSALEYPELQWSSKDQQALMKGTWWDQQTLPLPSPDAPDPTPKEVHELTSGKENSGELIIDPIPENLNEVDEFFLPEYIRTETGLIDPQKLLGEVERNDVIELIRFIKKNYHVNLFVSIFAPGQKIPPSINAPTMSRQIFKENERNLLLHFHLGDLKNTQIALDQELTQQLRDDGRRDLLYRVKQDASVYSDPQDELLAAMASLVTRTESDFAGTHQKQVAQASGQKDKIPEVSITIQEQDEKKKGALEIILEQVLVIAQENLLGIIIPVVGFLMLLFGLYFWRTHRTVHLLAPLNPGKRLKAPHGAARSQAFRYDDPHRSKSGSIGRQQIRQHIKDVS